MVKWDLVQLLIKEPVQKKIIFQNKSKNPIIKSTSLFKNQAQENKITNISNKTTKIQIKITKASGHKNISKIKSKDCKEKLIYRS